MVMVLHSNKNVGELVTESTDKLVGHEVGELKSGVGMLTNSFTGAVVTGAFVGIEFVGCLVGTRVGVAVLGTRVGFGVEGLEVGDKVVDT